MKLASFATAPGQAKRIGVALESGNERALVDLTAAYASYLWDLNRNHAAAEIARAQIPADMCDLIALGPRRFELPKQAVEYVQNCLGRGHSVEELVDQGLVFKTTAVHFLPVVPRPGKVICAGTNYRSHAAESAGGRVPDAPEHPVAFAKFPSVLIGHEEEINYPSGPGRQLDYEGELALVIGDSCRGVSRDQALDFVVGYTIFNDVSVRDIQFDEMKRGMLLLGKNFDGCGPLGPYLVTSDEVPDPQALQLRTRVNGAMRQEASTSDLIFGCDQLVEYWSKVTLEPGDVIATGTPSGVGIFMDPPAQYLLKPGDVVEVEIDGLGLLRNRVAKPSSPAGRP
ncbi:MAG TPA: fumarylacetoacetate hydrolase family protein [Candidatus Acidoferrum sp.]|jgi:acylpyruvate hydrolase|nr:fumarylacetoacetate hydrolase family protein [Candidatus Acidoferrum sp.]